LWPRRQRDRTAAGLYRHSFAFARTFTDGYSDSSSRTTAFTEQPDVYRDIGFAATLYSKRSRLYRSVHNRYRLQRHR